MPNDAQGAWIESLCSSPPVPGQLTGTLVPNPVPDDDTSFVSPPIVDDPIYACSRAVGVIGAALGATVEVEIQRNGMVGFNPASSTTVERPTYHNVFVSQPFQSGDQVRARQIVDGQPSDYSRVVPVRNHQLDYPNGLPAPSIVPDYTHECAHRIAVSHVKGATLVVNTSQNNGNDGNTKNEGYASGYSVARGLGPFVPNARLRVHQQLCTDASSPSEPAFARPEPNVFPTIGVAEEIMEQQQLLDLTSIVEGASLLVERPSNGFSRSIWSWPVSFYPDLLVGDPLVSSEVVRVTQSLCTSAPPIDLVVTKSCGDLKPPRIATVRDGDDFIIVMEAVPGARIRVYDEQANEIGDGSANKVQLARPVNAGEQLTVTQVVGECPSELGLQLEVAEPSN